MADIVFKYDEMNTAVTQIKDLASQYKSAADTFENDFLSAISSWEGDSKDKMSSFISTPVKEYMATTVPKLLESLADLLQSNISQMQKADQQIAELQKNLDQYNSSNAAQEGLEEVREGAKKLSEQAKGVAIAYESSAETLDYHMEQEERQQEAKAILDQMKNARK